MVNAEDNDFLEDVNYHWVKIPVADVRYYVNLNLWFLILLICSCVLHKIFSNLHCRDEQIGLLVEDFWLKLGDENLTIHLLSCVIDNCSD